MGRMYRERYIHNFSRQTGREVSIEKPTRRWEVNIEWDLEEMICRESNSRD